MYGSTLTYVSRVPIRFIRRHVTLQPDVARKLMMGCLRKTRLVLTPVADLRIVLPIDPIQESLC
jgi:hypothetical protein